MISSPESITQTAARVRILDGRNQETMRIGFNQVAEGYFRVDAVRHWIQYAHGRQVGANRPGDAAESPYVSSAFEVSPPLDPAQLQQLGERLINGSLLAEQTVTSPDGIGVFDNRGRNTPDSPLDRGLPIALMLPGQMAILQPLQAVDVA